MVKHILVQLARATCKVFSKLDANSGFYRIPLNLRLAKLTTFVTPFVRYNNRLPFGITSPPKHFHRGILKILSRVTLSVSIIDDVLVFSKNQEERNKHLTVALEKIQ